MSDIPKIHRQLAQLLALVDELEGELRKERTERAQESDVMAEILVRIAQAERRASVAEERLAAVDASGGEDRAFAFGAQKKLAEAEARAENAEARLADSLAAVRELEEAADHSEDLAATLASQLTEAEESLGAMRRELDGLRRQSANAASPVELEQARARVEDLEARLKERDEQAHRAATEYAATFARLAKEHASKLARLAEEHAEHVGRLEEDRTSQVARIEQKHAADLAAQQVKHEAALAKPREEKDSAVAKAREERDTAISKLQQERYETFAKMRAEKEEAVASVRKETESLIEILREEKDDALAELAKQESAVARLRKENESLTKRLASTVEDRERLAGELTGQRRQSSAITPKSALQGFTEEPGDGPEIEVEGVSDLLAMLDSVPKQAKARALMVDEEDDPPTRPRGPSTVPPRVKQK